MHKGGDVICLSHLRWGFVFQRPNHLMSRCARERRVFFFEEPTYDAEQSHLAVTQVAPNLYSAVPRLPASLAADPVSAQRAALAELCATYGIENPLLWFYTPMALAFAEDLPCALTIYDCMDELSAFHGAPPELCEMESKLLDRADLVFTGGHSLYEAKRSRHGNVHAMPSSVDAAHFYQARLPTFEPADQAPIAYPRLGFFGVIDERMDLELIDRVAREQPDWQLVMLGPVVKIDPEALPRRPNIHYLGQKKYEELPAYISGWHVALMPFALNEATRFISPTKTLEYMAGGRPIVSTAIRDVVTPYGEEGLVRIAGHGDFVAAIEDALAESVGTRRAQMDEFLAETSWDKTWAQMSELIAEALGPQSKVA
jgi:glycosyltransferase involved in cell wall biosynthesis